MTADEIFGKYMENPHWKRQYDEAPSEACKEYIKYSYIWSGMNWFKTGTSAQKEKAHEKMTDLKGKFDREDWEYIIKTAGGATAKAEYTKQMKQSLGEE